MVILFGQLAAMCPKPKHLKHFVLEVLVGDLGVEMEGVLFSPVDSLRRLTRTTALCLLISF